MKLTKIYASIAVLASLAMASCSEGKYWDSPSNPGEVYAFAKPAETVTLGGTDEVPATFDVVVGRNNKGASVTVPVTFAANSNSMTGASEVTFEAGSATAVYKINIAPDLQIGTTYTATVTLPQPTDSLTVAKAENRTFTLNVSKNYIWSSIGKGKFFDAWVMDNATEEYTVEIMKADGFNRYRVMSPYKEYYSTLGPASWENWIGSTGPSYIEFWENANGKLSFNSYNTGLYYQAVSSQPIGAYSWSAFSGGSYTGDYDVWYAPGFAVLSPVYYINGVGGYGQQVYAVQITLPE